MSNEAAEQIPEQNTKRKLSVVRTLSDQISDKRKERVKRYNHTQRMQQKPR